MRTTNENDILTEESKKTKMFQENCKLRSFKIMLVSDQINVLLFYFPPVSVMLMVYKADIAQWARRVH